MTGNFKANYFCRILDKFTRSAKPIRIIGDPYNQLPYKWRSTVIPFLYTKSKHNTSVIRGLVTIDSILSQQ